MYALLRRGYVTEVIALVVATVVLGSAVAYAVAWATHGFFAGTARGILGEEGDHHIAVHVRSDMRLEARQALKALAKSARWAGVTEGMTILGRTNFMIDLDRTESAQFRWALGAIGDVPGYLGKTIVAEPKVTVSGLSGAAAGALQEALAAEDRVRFTLRDGSSLHLMLDSAENVSEVSELIDDLLDEFHEVQVQTIDGSDISREAILKHIETGAAAGLEDSVRDRVSVWDADEDASDGRLPEALAVLRRAALSWAPSVKIELEDGASVKTGDRVWLNYGTGRAEAEIAAVDGSTALGVVVSGRVPASSDDEDRGSGVNATNNRGTSIGPAEVISASSVMEKAIDAIEGSTAGVADAARAASEQAEAMSDVLNSFDGAEQAVAMLKAALDSHSSGRVAPLSLDGVKLLASLAEKSIEALDRLSTVASGVSLITSSYDGLIEDLAKWRGEIARFRQQLASIESAAGQVSGGAGLITEATVSVQAMVRALEAMDLASLRDAVGQAGAQLESLASLDSTALHDAFAQLRSSAPELTGEQALALITTVDSLYGQVGGDDEASFVVRAEAPSDSVTRAIAAELGDGYTVFTGPAGLLSRGVSAEVRALLATVRATIAGMTCIVLTGAALVIDHATLASGVIAMARPGRRLRRDRLHAVVYCAIAGAVTLAASATIAGGNLVGYGRWPFALIGALLGAATGLAAGRLAPCNRDEVEAGLAWGIGPAAIMREIVVPASRPGLLVVINRVRQVLPGSYGRARQSARRGKGGVKLCSECKT